MKKKLLVLGIIVLAIVGVFSFVNIFKVGQSFVGQKKYAAGIDSITDAALKSCVQGMDENATELNCSNMGVTIHYLEKLI